MFVVCGWLLCGAVLRLTVVLLNELDALASVHAEAITNLVHLTDILIYSMFSHLILWFFVHHTGCGWYQLKCYQFIPRGIPCCLLLCVWLLLLLLFTSTVHFCACLRAPIELVKCVRITISAVARRYIVAETEQDSIELIQILRLRWV